MDGVFHQVRPGAGVPSPFLQTTWTETWVMLLGIHGLKSCHLSSKDPQHMSPAPGVSIAGCEVQGRVVGVLCPASPPVERAGATSEPTP